MKKSALGVAVSFFVFVFAMQLAQAETGAKTSARKHLHKTSSKRRSHATAHVGSSNHAGLHRRVVMVDGKRKVYYERVTYTPRSNPVRSAGDLAGLNATHDPLSLRSNAALVIDQNTSQVLFEKNSNKALPIASLTKLMTALVVVESHQDMDEVLTVTADDVDHIKHTGSRLRVGSMMKRSDMLHIALMSSENRAASALGRNYPGGEAAFVAAMNAKAKELGMFDTHYIEPTGLSSQNVSSARDLAKLVMAAYQHPVIRRYSTDDKYAANAGKYVLNYITSNRLVRNAGWDIGLQKTGFINEAGHCLVMQSRINSRPVVMVLLDSEGKYSRFADADRVRHWIEVSKPQMLTQVSVPQS